jgi:hypothetical protein
MREQKYGALAKTFEESNEKCLRAQQCIEAGDEHLNDIIFHTQAVNRISLS